MLKVGESWNEEPESMVYQKRYAESIVFNGEMLVMGGYNQNIGWLNAVEKRSSDGSWTEMEPWTLPRMIFDFCAVQMDENRIMVLGKAYTFCLLGVMAIKISSPFSCSVAFSIIKANFLKFKYSEKAKQI